MKANEVFVFGDNMMRMIQVENAPWFVAMDVARILDYSDAHKMIQILDDDEFTTIGTDNFQNRLFGGSEQGRTAKIQGFDRKIGGSELLNFEENTPKLNSKGTIIINESGLYHIVISSHKAQAKAFRRWVTAEVLPSIRKTGMYINKNLIPDAAGITEANYPFFNRPDAYSLIESLNEAMQSGVLKPYEWRHIVLNARLPISTRNYDNDVQSFFNKNFRITGQDEDFIPVESVYEKYKEEFPQSELSRNKFTRTIRSLYLNIQYKQRKINGYPILVFARIAAADALQGKAQ
ncbi:BRO-N domain-containing protein [Treponema sp. SP13]|uniref:BRO-N domain-containing protein n=1 Tax=Treponema sp. SP13 TaxID=2789742 RepID=UPI003D8C6700